MQSLILAVFAVLMALPPSRHDTETINERAGRMYVTAHAMVTVAADQPGPVSEADARMVRAVAKLMTQGFTESKFDQAVGATDCRKGTCDWHSAQGFRARGFWQNWKNKRNADDWEAAVGWNNDALLASARMAHWSLSRCKNAAHSFQAQDGDGCRQGAMGDFRYKRMLQAENAIRVVRAGGEVPQDVRRWE